MDKDKKFNFTKAIEELEEINRWFQNEEIDLEEGLTKFRHGLELIKKCRERLKIVENEFKEIKKEFSEDEEVKAQIEPNNLSNESEKPHAEGIPF